MRVGLVLGAGGVGGQAYHAGVLAALEHDYGWDSRTADIIVGTSAGAVTGTLLRGGVPASELAAWTVRAPLEPEGAVLQEMFGRQYPELEPFRAHRLLLGLPPFPGWGMLRQGLLRPWHLRPLGIALAILPDGRFDIVERLSALADLNNSLAAQDDLWICAVRRRDGRRVVFGHSETPEVPLHLAASASCAVPGHFAPVTIGDESYVDGGAHSPTNADLLSSSLLDLVIVVSPMSGPVDFPPGVFGLARARAARIARREVRNLRRAGAKVVVFRPGPPEQKVLGNDFMTSDRVHDVVQESFLAAGRYAARLNMREML